MKKQLEQVAEFHKAFNIPILQDSQTQEPELWGVYKIEGLQIAEVSNLGRVRSLVREVTTHRGGKHFKGGNILAPLNNGNGYLGVSVGNKRYYIHRMVASVFLGNPENKPHVNHIDCDRGNNCASNLEWCTAKENSAHKIKMGRFKSGHLYGSNHGKSKKIFQYSLDGDFIRKWDFIRDAAKSLSISENQLSRVSSKKNGSSGGFQWRRFYTPKIPHYSRNWGNRHGRGKSEILYNEQVMKMRFSH